jgi:hypothetical protein
MMMCRLSFLYSIGVRQGNRSQQSFPTFSQANKSQAAVRLGRIFIFESQLISFLLFLTGVLPASCDKKQDFSPYSPQSVGVIALAN